MAQPRDALKAAIEALLVQVRVRGGWEAQEEAEREGAGWPARIDPSIDAAAPRFSLPQIDDIEASLTSFDGDADALAQRM